MLSALDRANPSTLNITKKIWKPKNLKHKIKIMENWCKRANERDFYKSHLYSEDAEAGSYMNIGVPGVGDSCRKKYNSVYFKVICLSWEKLSIYRRFTQLVRGAKWMSVLGVMCPQAIVFIAKRTAIIHVNKGAIRFTFSLLTKALRLKVIDLILFNINLLFSLKQWHSNFLQETAVRDCNT